VAVEIPGQSKSVPLTKPPMTDSHMTQQLSAIAVANKDSEKLYSNFILLLLHMGNLSSGWTTGGEPAHKRREQP
jgi:hypothetical protein